MTVPDPFDPLADRRSATEPEVDLFVWGTVFLDMVFAGMGSGPVPGTEIWAEGMASCPGGIANLAVAASRLGLRTSLGAAFGDDHYGDFCWRTLSEQEGIDLSRSRRCAGWHSPVTVSMSFHDDRAMVTHGHPAPLGPDAIIGRPPTTRTVIVDLGEAFDPVEREVRWPDWVAAASATGATVFADIGWDPAGDWSREVLDALDRCHAFTPNAAEAMAYTRTDTPRAALYALADRVPLAVVTDGIHGALAIDAETGEEATVPAVTADAVDPTGCGDVFGAALVTGTLAGWALADRLAFANLCSSLALGHYGGSLAAPGWGDVADWWRALGRVASPDAEQRSLLRRYAFLASISDDLPASACRRATATIPCA